MDKNAKNHNKCARSYFRLRTKVIVSSIDLKLSG
jgi:hypothetical protein